MRDPDKDYRTACWASLILLCCILLIGGMTLKQDRKLRAKPITYNYGHCYVWHDGYEGCVHPTIWSLP